MTDQQKATLKRLQKQAYRLGGTVFTLKTLEDGTLIVADGHGMLQINKTGHVSTYSNT